VNYGQRFIGLTVCLRRWDRVMDRFMNLEGSESLTSMMNSESSCDPSKVLMSMVSRVLNQIESRVKDDWPGIIDLTETSPSHKKNHRLGK
jgi:hypothetical protein